MRDPVTDALIDKSISAFDLIGKLATNQRLLFDLITNLQHQVEILNAKTSTAPTNPTSNEQ